MLPEKRSWGMRASRLGLCAGISLLLSGPWAAASEPAEPGQSEEPGTEPFRRLVLCLDGTWNSTFDEKKTEAGTYVLKPTNVLKLCRSVKSEDESGTSQLIFYLTGVGSVPRYPGVSNAIYSTTDKYLGGVWGAGFEANVEAALDFLNMNYRVGDEVYIFGFSRGAATARGVTQFLGWSGGLPSRADAYYLPLLFREFIRVRGAGDARAWIKDTNSEREDENPSRDALETFNHIPVTYLGVWDTVMALGSRFEATGVKNATVSRSFYVDDRPAVDVKTTRQALAIDERRYDFRPEIWREARPGQSMVQRWFPGVHSNVGGGYRHDGLANGAFRWLIKGAEEQGLELESDFVKFYRPYPQDTLYNTYTAGAEFIDAVRFKLNAGVRQLAGHPETANMSIDPSFAIRLISDPEARNKEGDLKFPRMDQKPYRPDNALQFLACDASAHAQLADLEESLGTDEQRARLRALLEAQRSDRCPAG